MKLKNKLEQLQKLADALEGNSDDLRCELLERAELIEASKGYGIDSKLRAEGMRSAAAKFENNRRAFGIIIDASQTLIAQLDEFLNGGEGPSPQPDTKE